MAIQTDAASCLLRGVQRRFTGGGECELRQQGVCFIIQAYCVLTCMVNLRNGGLCGV